MMLIISLVSSFLVYLGLRLSIQSSYYADPDRRLCGTLDRFFAKCNDTANSMVRFVNKKTGWKLQELAYDDLSIYHGVKQWWWLPSQAPGNLAIKNRFLAQKQEKLGQC